MTTILLNGHIYQNRGQFAQAMLIEDGVIRLVGTNEEILAAAPADCERIDAEGRTVVPGFNDSHLHLHNLGTSLNSVRLSDATKLADLIERGRAFIDEHQVPAGGVVTGRGWNQDYFTDESRLPTRHDLDKISTDHAVIYTRACGHMLSCNTKALEMAGVDAATPQIAGATFELEADGTPSGIFTETAQGLINAIVPALTPEDMAKNLKAAMEYASSFGITSTQSNDINNENFRNMLAALDLLEKNGEMPLRNYAQCCFYNLELFGQFLADGHRTGSGSPVNKIGPLKVFVDGSLGARTALMRQDYADEPGTRGIAVFTQEELDGLVAKADENGLQVAIHAIGDKAIEMVLDSYDKVIHDHRNTRRHGIVHCQITDAPLIERFKENDIVAYVQPIFIHYDMHVVADRVGKELASTSYAFGTMFRKGIHVAYGSDCPVEDLSTMDNLYCAVTRKDLSGRPAKGYYPEEAVDIYDAIDNYTAGGAYTSFEEDVKGRLIPGHYGDFAILDRDIFAIPADEIRDVKVLTTVMGGKVVFQR